MKHSLLSYWITSLRGMFTSTNNHTNIAPPPFADTNNQLYTTVRSLLLRLGSLSALSLQNGITFSRLNLTRCALLVALILGSVNAWGAEIGSLLTGGSFASNYPTEQSWNSSDEDFYDGNGYKFDVDGEILKSPSLGIGHKEVRVKIMAGHNGGSGSTILIGAYSSSDELLASVTFTPTEAYKSQKTLNEYTLSSASSDIDYIKLTFSKSKNCGMKELYIYELLAPAEPIYNYWSVDGKDHDITETTTGKPVLPEEEPSQDCDGRVFVGWTTEEDYKHATEKPVVLFKTAADAPNVTTETTFYAVFAREGEGGTAAQTITLDYDTWTYGGGTNTSTDKKSYRLFHNGGYIESQAFDLSTLQQVVIKMRKFGNGSSHAVSIQDASGNQWNTAEPTSTSLTDYTVSSSTQLTGTGVLRIKSTFGTYNSNASSASGVGISKVTITYLASSYTDYVTTCGGGSTEDCTEEFIIENGVTNINEGIELKDNLFISDNTNDPTFICTSANSGTCTIDKNNNTFTATAAGAYTISVTQEADGTYCDVDETFTIYVRLATPTNPTQTSTATTAHLSWTDVDGATGYTVQMLSDKTENATVLESFTTPNTYYDLSELKQNTYYVWGVIATNGTTECNSEQATSDFTTTSLATYTIEWYNNGLPYTTGGGTTSVTEGERITAIPTPPAAPMTCAQKKFMGWADHEILVATDEKPTLYKALSDFPAPSGNELTIKYYAVFADEKTTEGGESTEYTLVTSLEDLHAGDAYLGTQSSGYSSGPAGGYSYMNDATSTAINNSETLSLLRFILPDNKVLPDPAAAGKISLISTGTTNQYYICNASKEYLYSNADKSISWSTTPCGWTFSNVATNGTFTVVSSEKANLYLRGYTSSNTNALLRTYDGKTTNSGICVFLGNGGSTTSYSNYVTKCEALDETKWHNVTIVSSVAAETGCSVTPETTRVYDTDETTLKATVGAGYTFAGWSVTSGTAEIENPTSTSTTLKNITTTDVTVTANFIPVATEKYILVTDASTLVAGDVLLIADNKSNVVAKTIGENLDANEGALDYGRLLPTFATFSDNVVTGLGDNYMTLTLGGTEDNWTLTNAAGQRLSTNGGGSSYVWTETTSTSQTDIWTISITKSSATLKTLKNTEKEMLFATKAQWFIHTTIGEGINKPQLYRKNVICGLEVIKPKTDYIKGVDNDFVVPQVNAIYTDGDKKENISGATFSAIDLTKEGTQEITVTYKEDNRTVTTTYEVTVHGPKKVTFMDNGSQYGDEQTVSYNGYATEPSPAPAGCLNYVFQYWTTVEAIADETVAPAEFDFSTPITDNTTLYAVYKHIEKEAGDGEEYVLVTDVADLSKAKDDKIIITNADHTQALSTIQNKNNRGQEVVTVVDNTVTAFDNNVQILTLQSGTTEGTQAFYTGSGYLYAAASDGNHLKTESELSANSSWNITIVSNGVATIKATGDKERNWLRYNTSGWFSCYGENNTQKDVCIFRAKATDKITYTLTADCHAEISATKVSSMTASRLEKVYSVEGTLTLLQATGTPTKALATISGTDAAMFPEVTINDWVSSASGDIYTATYRVAYKPTVVGHAKHTATIIFSYDDNGTPCATEEIALTGYTLPSEFVIATQIDGAWVALPGNMTKMDTYPVVPILVDDATNTTIANSVTDEALKYTLKDRHSSSLSTVLEAVRFKNISSTEALKANTSTGDDNNGIMNEGENASSNDVAYEWTLTTENGIDYSIYNPNRGRYLNVYGKKTWGVYGSVGAMPIRFFAVSESIDVVEWGAYKDKVGVTLNLSDYDQDLTLSVKRETSKGNYENVVTDVAISALANGDGTHTIEISDIVKSPCKHLQIEVSGGRKITLRIPVIVATTPKSYKEAFAAVQDAHGTTDKQTSDLCKTCDVVIKNTGEAQTILTYTPQTNSYYSTVHNLYINAGAKLNVESGTLNANTLTLRSDFDAVPQVEMNGSLNIEAQSFKLIKHIDDQRYYFFSVPYDYPVADVEIDGATDKYADVWIAAHYNGAGRAENQGQESNWDNLMPEDITNLQAGKGYSIALATGDAPYTKDLVFNFSLTGKDLSADNTKTATYGVTAHGKEAYDAGKLHQSNVGWNFIANPFLSEHTAEHTFTMPQAMEGTTYVAIPAAGTNQTYTQHEFSELTAESGKSLLPFTGFFVQVAADGDATFAKGNRTIMAAPQHTATEEIQKPLVVGLTLTNGTYTDATSLVIGNQFTDAYEIGSDFEKMLGLEQYPQLYIHDEAYRYAFKSLSEDAAANVIPLGVYLPSKEATEYTIALKDNVDVSRLQGVYLTDYTTHAQVNLLDTDYRFTSAAREHLTARFALSAVLAPKAVTELTNTDNIQWSVWQDAPLHISLQGLMAGDDVRVIDATGKLVTQITATDTAANFALPTAGAYCVQVMGAQGLQVKKIIVK